MKFFAFLVGFLCVFSSSQAQQLCDWGFPSYNLSGLSFCSFLNGEEIDIMFSGETASVFDGYLETAWQEIYSYVEGVASSNGFTFCDSCMDELKKMMCVTAFPPVGYWNCFMSEFANFYAEACPSLCEKEGECCFVCPKSNPDCDDKVPSNPSQSEILKCSQEIQQNFGDLMKAIQECSAQFGPSKDICEDYVSVCSCGQNSGDSFCDFYGWSEGNKPSNLPPKGPNCNWCNTKKRELEKEATKMALFESNKLLNQMLSLSKRQQGAATFKINDKLSLGGVPSGLSAEGAFGFGMSPSVEPCVTPQQQSCNWVTTKQNNQNPDDKDSENSDATTLKVTSILSVITLCLFFL